MLRYWMDGLDRKVLIKRTWETDTGCYIILWRELEKSLNRVIYAQSSKSVFIKFAPLSKAIYTLPASITQHQHQSRCRLSFFERVSWVDLTKALTVDKELSCRQRAFTFGPASPAHNRLYIAYANAKCGEDNS
jgi:hypothetical protein